MTAATRPAPAAKPGAARYRGKARGVQVSVRLQPEHIATVDERRQPGTSRADVMRRLIDEEVTRRALTTR